MTTVAGELVSGGHHQSKYKPEYFGRHRSDSLRAVHRRMHTQEIPFVKPGWFRYLERRGQLRRLPKMPQNKEQSFTWKTLGAMIFCAFAIAVAFSAGVLMTIDVWRSITRR